MVLLLKKYIFFWRKNLVGLDGEFDNIDWKYEIIDNYLKFMEKNGVGLNEVYLVLYGNIRMEVFGLDNI